jgi:DNA replication protein DnaC
LAEDSTLVRITGENPCPTEGCEGVGVTYTLAGRTVEGFCPACVEAAEAADKKREHDEQVARYIDRAGITPRLTEFSMGSYPDDEAGRAAKLAALRWHDAIIAWRENRETAPAPGNLLMYGPVGSGKTGLLAPVVVMLCESLVPVRFMDFPTLLEQMKDAYSKRVPFAEFTNLTDVPVLVLDDLGAEKPTEWACGQLLRLVNTRYEKLLPTAYLSNYTPGDLSKRLGHEDPVVGERIVSRMVEGSIQHRMKAPDRRTP